MANITSSVDPIFALSIYILNAQKISNIIWTILCVLDVLVSFLQILTMLLWKPLRKVENSLILAIALGDFVKSAVHGVVGIKRLYLVFSNQPEVTNQQICVAWIFGIPTTTHMVTALLLMVSLDRLLALLTPIWYRNQKIGFKLFLISFSISIGLVSGFCSFIGSRPDLMQPICAFGTSPIEKYRTYATWFENSMVISILVINLISCGTVVIRWRLAAKTKADLKIFKKNIQLNALKTLLAIVGLCLISSTLEAVWFTLINTLGWDDVMKMSYTPIAGCFVLTRGVFDFPLYLTMVREYRKGFSNVFLKWKCRLKISDGSSSMTPTATDSSRGRVNTIPAVQN